MKSKKFLSVRFTKNATCILEDEFAELKLKAGGYGYDKVGTVLGKWLMSLYEEELNKLEVSSFYGLYQNDKGHKWLEGACGQECMRDIAKAIGLDMFFIYFQGKILGIMVEGEHSMLFGERFRKTNQ